MVQTKKGVNSAVSGRNLRCLTAPDLLDRSEDVRFQEEELPVGAPLAVQLITTMDTNVVSRDLSGGVDYDSPDVGYAIDPMRDPTTDRLEKIEYAINSGLDASAAQALTSTSQTTDEPTETPTEAPSEVPTETPVE